mmetsp:Transcript_153908/g.268209  ORF Transcript_153908/g.268209 Transcript_153908/m.268209 type:complete len:209 (-) Transcript_153908:335-961(-)
MGEQSQIFGNTLVHVSQERCISDLAGVFQQCGDGLRRHDLRGQIAKHGPALLRFDCKPSKLQHARCWHSVACIAHGKEVLHSFGQLPLLHSPGNLLHVALLDRVNSACAYTFCWSRRSCKCSSHVSCNAAARVGQGVESRAHRLLCTHVVMLGEDPLNSPNNCTLTASGDESFYDCPECAESEMLDSRPGGKNEICTPRSPIGLELFG